MKSGKHIKRKNKVSTSKILILILLVSVICIIIIKISSKKEQEQTNNLLNSVVIEEVVQNQQPERVLQVRALKEQYPDVVGWLEVPGTNINYPVMQGTDNNYYVKHDYKREYSFNGAIFLDKDYDWTIPSSNLLMYGHNNKNDIMFAQLLKYKDKNFYEQNPIIKFTTIEEDAEYEIISVFLSRVYYKSEQNVFRYYYFIHAENEAEYNQYVQDAKEASLYNIETTAQYGDQLITLSTCEYSQEDGRFVVVGRKK